MYDPGLVRCRQCVRHLYRRVERFAQFHRRAPHPPAQCLTINELSGDEMNVTDFSDFKNSDDVRMIQGRSRARFSLEAIKSFAIPGELPGQQLERNLTSELQVLGQVDISHPAGSQQREYQVVSHLPPQ